MFLGVALGGCVVVIELGRRLCQDRQLYRPTEMTRPSSINQINQINQPQKMPGALSEEERPAVVPFQSDCRYGGYGTREGGEFVNETWWCRLYGLETGLESIWLNGNIRYRSTWVHLIPPYPRISIPP